jgi:hypothetical protein
MKLILCRVCNETYSLAEHDKRCSCNRTGGRLFDKLGKTAEYWGLPGVPLQFDGWSFSIAVNTVEKYPTAFQASVYPRDSETFRYREPPPDAVTPATN